VCAGESVDPSIERYRLGRGAPAEYAAASAAIRRSSVSPGIHRVRSRHAAHAQCVSVDGVDAPNVWLNVSRINPKTLLNSMRPGEGVASPAVGIGGRVVPVPQRLISLWYSGLFGHNRL
jgi:hypothetical protein